MKKLFILVVMFLSLVVFCQKSFGAIDNPETKLLCNKIIQDIYNDILKLKIDIAELQDFTADNLIEGKKGVYYINYEFSKSKNRKRKNFSFGITITDIESEKLFNEQSEQLITLGFPLLELKFDGYQNRTLSTEKFDLNSLVQKNGKRLLIKQNEMLPLKLSVKTKEKQYKTGEVINFVVNLTNASDRSFEVKDITTETLMFVYNDVAWHVREASPGAQGVKKVALKAGESITREFIGTGFYKPRKYEVDCFYLMTYRGVNPTSYFNFDIIEKESFLSNF